jgi:DNA modification methylase
MTVQLFHGDCLQVMPTLKENSVDLVFTSPPYFNARPYSEYADYDAYLAFLREFFVQARRVLKPNRIFVLNVSCVIVSRTKRSEESTRLPIPFDCVIIAREQGFKFIDDIIWVKPDGASNRAIKFSHHRRPVAYKPFAVTEYLLVFKGDDGGLLDDVIRVHDPMVIESSLVQNGYERTNVWNISPERNNDHPAPFPLSIAEKVVTYYSFTGDTVLDAMMGSGTTGVACQQIGRNFVGIEKDADYFEIAKRRIETERDQLRFDISM